MVQPLLETTRLPFDSSKRKEIDLIKEKKYSEADKILNKLEDEENKYHSKRKAFLK